MKATKPLVFDGETISHRVGHVLVMMTCVRPGASYRVAVQHGSTGAEVPELTANYATETGARSAARNACYAFAAGQTVTAVLNQLAEANHTVAISVRTPIVLVERTALPRETGPAGLIRITPPQYRLLTACLFAGTDELVPVPAAALAVTHLAPRLRLVPAVAA